MPCWSTACCSRRSTWRWPPAVRPRRSSTPRTRSSGADPLVEMFAPGLEIANARRAELGLPAIERLATSTTPARARSSRCRRSLSPTCRMRATCCASDRCSTRLRCAGGRRGRPPDRTDTAGPRQVEHQRAGPGRPAAAVRPGAQLPVDAIVTTGPSIDPMSVSAGANTQVARYVPPGSCPWRHW